LPPGASRVRLPDDARVKVLAATVTRSVVPSLRAAWPLFDTLVDHVQDSPSIVPPAGAFADSVRLAIEPRLYWRPGSIRFTLDGSEPGTSSPVYEHPFFVDRPMTVRSAVLDPSGKVGPVVGAKLEVRDVTPPRFEKGSVVYGSPLVHLHFSEPLDASALRVE